jgi:hypothetical protein
MHVRVVRVDSTDILHGSANAPLVVAGLEEANLRLHRFDRQTGAGKHVPQGHLNELKGGGDGKFIFAAVPHFISPSPPSPPGPQRVNPPLLMWIRVSHLYMHPKVGGGVHSNVDVYMHIVTDIPCKVMQRYEGVPAPALQVLLDVSLSTSKPDASKSTCMKHLASLS